MANGPPGSPPPTHTHIHNCHNVGLDGLKITTKPLIPLGTSLLAGVCSAVLFRPPHSFISHWRSFSEAERHTFLMLLTAVAQRVEQVD